MGFLAIQFYFLNLNVQILIIIVRNELAVTVMLIDEYTLT